MKGTVISVNISEKKGTAKKPVGAADVIENFGLAGDVHSGSCRQVSLVGWEEVEEWFKGKSGKIKINYGDFAENITTAGIDWRKTKAGDKIIVGKTAKLEITRIGKECHHGCAIRNVIGDCIMPRRGVFAKVLVGGRIKTGDEAEIQND